jgi:hypothetical protein
LQVASHAVGYGQCDDESSYSRGHTGDGDGSYYAHHGLPPFGLQIPRCKKKLKSHPAYFSFFKAAAAIGAMTSAGRVNAEQMWRLIRVVTNILVLSLLKLGQPRHVWNSGGNRVQIPAPLRFLSFLDRLH